jgi:hypothetical protein
MTGGAGTTSRAVNKPSCKAAGLRRAPETARSSTPATSSLDDLQKQLEVGTRKLNVALAQQAATGEVPA